MEDGFVRFIPWMFVGFGVVLAGGSLWVIRSETRGRRWREVEGRITGYHTHSSRNYEGMVSTLHSAEIEYKLPGMPAAQMIDEVATGALPEVGERVRLRYNPDDHRQIMRWAPQRLGLFYTIFLAMGLLFIAAGVIALTIEPS
ncbi:DUF3592 domain-containing protein [Sphingopyxis sp.]|uniref:DUF3592 domain-containing protein n=1 Tax=Sphingopyxis sp. TaxID=1908224 RepID=UPI003D0D00B7